MILLPHPAPISQPQGRSEIDWSNPLARGLGALLLPQRYSTAGPSVDLVTGIAADLPNTTKFNVEGEGGICLDGNLASVSVHGWKYIPAGFGGSVNSAGFTFAGVIQHRRTVAPISGGYHVGIASELSNSPLGGLGAPTSGDSYRIRLHLRNTSSTVVCDVVTTDTILTDGKPHTVVGVYNPAGSGEAYIAVDGRIVPQTNSTLAGNSSAIDATRMGLGGIYRATLQSATRSALYGGALYGRALLRHEAAQLSANLWQLLLTPRGRSFVPFSISTEPAAGFFANQASRLSQPQGRIEIDSGNPLTRGLVDAVFPGLLRTARGVAPTTLASNTTSERHPLGIVRQTSGTSSDV